MKGCCFGCAQINLPGFWDRNVCWEEYTQTCLKALLPQVGHAKEEAIVNWIKH